MPEPTILDYALPSAPPRPTLRVAAAVIFPVMYLPYAWLVFMHYPWDEYRWHWIKMWPILPGILAGLTLSSESTTQYFVMICATLVLLTMMLWIGTRSRLALILGAIVIATFSTWNSWVAYSLFYI